MGSPINNRSFNRTSKNSDDEETIYVGPRNNVRMGEISIEGKKKGVKKKEKAAASPRARSARPKDRFKGLAGKITARLPGRPTTVQKQFRITAEKERGSKLVDLDTLADRKKTTRDEAVATLQQAIDFLQTSEEKEMRPTLDLARAILAQRSKETSRYFDTEAYRAIAIPNVGESLRGSGTVTETLDQLNGIEERLNSGESDEADCARIIDLYVDTLESALKDAKSASEKGPWSDDAPRVVEFLRHAIADAGSLRDRIGEGSEKVERKDAAGRPAEVRSETLQHFDAKEYDGILAGLKGVLSRTARDRLKLGEVLLSLQNIHEELGEIRQARGAVTKEKKAELAELIGLCTELLGQAEKAAKEAQRTRGLDWAYPLPVQNSFKQLESFLSNALKEARSLEDRIGDS